MKYELNQQQSSRESQSGFVKLSHDICDGIESELHCLIQLAENGYTGELKERIHFLKRAAGELELPEKLAGEYRRILTRVHFILLHSTEENYLENVRFELERFHSRLDTFIQGKQFC